MRGIPHTEEISIGCDFNAHIRATSSNFDNLQGGFDFWDRNEGGTSLFGFARAFELMKAKLYFPKKEDRLVTFRSAVAKTQIDYLLLRKDDRGLRKYYKFISRPS